MFYGWCFNFQAAHVDETDDCVMKSGSGVLIKALVRRRRQHTVGGDRDGHGNGGKNNQAQPKYHSQLTYLQKKGQKNGGEEA